MNWQEVCDTPELTNLPFKIELNQQGQILMTPVKVYHSLFQGKITGLLYANLQNGDVLVECAIATEQGTKVADIAWASVDTLKVIRDETECSVAPEICIEVLSLANTEQEMSEKKELYFSCGAKEVWICNEDGLIIFFTQNGEVSNSLLVPDFPRKLYDA